jgi:hypothetical protein
MTDIFPDKFKVMLEERKKLKVSIKLEKEKPEDERDKNHLVEMENQEKALRLIFNSFYGSHSQG